MKSARPHVLARSAFLHGIASALCFGLLLFQSMGCAQIPQKSSKGSPVSSSADAGDRKSARDKKVTPVMDKKPAPKQDGSGAPAPAVDAAIDPSEPPPPARPPTFGGAGG